MSGQFELSKTDELLTAAYNSESAEDCKSNLEKFFEIKPLPFKEGAKSYLTRKGLFDKHDMNNHFNQLFLDLYANKLHSIYNKAMLTPHTPEQLKVITDNYNRAQAESKIYNILQMQKTHPQESCALTEKLLSKSDKNRKVLCQNPELLRWFIENSNTKVIYEIFKSDITQSQHWGNNLKERDAIEIIIKTKYGIPQDAIFVKLYDRWKDISLKVPKANVSLRVNTEIKDLQSKFVALLNVSQNKLLTQKINGVTQLISIYSKEHEKELKKQTTAQKVTHSITHLRETAKQTLRLGKLNTGKSQVKETKKREQQGPKIW